MLEARDLSFRYNAKTPWIFRSLSLNIAPKEMIGLSGPSGRGKSTLARVLCGYLSSPTGSIHVDGQEPDPGYHPVQLLFQHPELAVNPRFKARQILEEAWTPDPGLLDALRIRPEWLDRYPHELSGGEMQRVCVARALDPRTRYLVADEMTSMLDAITQAQIWKVVAEQVRTRDLGVYVISHDADLLARLCSRQDNFFTAIP
ncbi:MAG: ATP-binding cassette domain-containing protein, partial [Salinivirgaceae bacterium]|nr:ATP-binding cassette domain-containing protein [Salinivirgaceae bacterium]